MRHETDDETYYAIHEVYYADDGTVDAWSTEPADVSGDTIEDIIADLTKMTDCTTKPVLDYQAVPQPK